MNIDQIVSFLSKNTHLVIIGLYAYVLFQIEESEYVTMVLLTVATCLSICYLKKKPMVEGLNHDARDDDRDGRGSDSRKQGSDGRKQGSDSRKQGSGGSATANRKQGSDSRKQGSANRKQGFANREGFDNAPEQPGSNIVRQLPDVMGAYDGLCLQTGNRENWMKTPDETALVPNDALFTFLGNQGPEKPVFSDNSALTGPPIDGHPDSAKKMFMFANNRSSPNCCPSTYSTSTGCVCTTKNQRDFVASRGLTGQGGTINLQDI